MEAMILAAGLGTRLRPLTNEKPKALVEVDGVPMLERVARRLVEAGAHRLIVNVHHHADQVKAFVAQQQGFGVETVISVEPEQALETGGGLKHAAGLFEREAPFLLHNVDVVTDLDLAALYHAHQAGDALATLACRPPETDRYLLFDEAANLCGYATRDGEEHFIGDEADGAARGPVERLDFCGVQALSPRIFDLMTEEGKFSIIGVYVRLVREAGTRVVPYRIDGSFWLDIGTPERLEAARRAVR